MFRYDYSQKQSCNRLHAGKSALPSVLMQQHREIIELQEEVNRLKQKLSKRTKKLRETERARFCAEVHTEIFVKALRRATAPSRMGRDWSLGGYDTLYTQKPPAYLAPRYDPHRKAREEYNAEFW